MQFEKINTLEFYRRFSRRASIGSFCFCCRRGVTTRSEVGGVCEARTHAWLQKDKRCFNSIRYVITFLQSMNIRSSQCSESSRFQAKKNKLRRVPQFPPTFSRAMLGHYHVQQSVLLVLCRSVCRRMRRGPSS